MTTSLRALLRIRLRRAFGNAHWTLLAGLVPAWCIVWLRSSCVATPGWAAGALAAFTVCVALWTNHLRARDTTGWRQLRAVLGNAVYDLALLFALALVCTLVLGIPSGIGNCATARVRAAELILSASGARTQISERVEQSHALAGAGAGITIAVDKTVKSALVGDAGTIVVAGEDPPAVVILTPTLVDGVLKWSCQGLPARAMPSSCR